MVLINAVFALNERDQLYQKVTYSQISSIWSLWDMRFYLELPVVRIIGR